MRLSDLIKEMPLTLQQGAGDPDISIISCDSRQMREGGLFAALPGTHLDGHDYIEAAIANGAKAILCAKNTALPEGITPLYAEDIRSAYTALAARFWPKRGQMHVAVTGTNGKTSIVEYLRQIWQRVGWHAASIGTLGARTAMLNAPGQMIGTDGLTTPAAERLFGIIDQLAAQGMTHLAIEASSHGLAQDRLQGLAVHTAIFTNLTQDHLDYHKDMDSYFADKAKLFTRHLLPGGHAIINVDDPWGAKLADMLASAPVVVVRVGRSADCQFQIKTIETKGPCQLVTLQVGEDTLIYTLALSGAFQAENAVLAAVAAHMSGLPIHDAFGALPQLLPTAGRMQPVHGHPADAKIIIDYAHTPDALATALQALRAETEKALYVVFGCGGDRDAGKRELMGQAAARLADHIIITDDNPRSEDPAAIRADIRGGCPEAEEIAPRDKAIHTAISRLQSGDALLIAGKGHETVQQIGTESLPFDDAAVARVAIDRLEPDDA